MGFVWAQNSCAFDSIYTTLYRVYLRLNEAERVTVSSSIRGGRVFEQLARGDIDHIQAKRALMPEVYHRGSGFVLGQCYTVENVWRKIVDDIPVDLDNDQVNNAFAVKTKVRKTCTTAGCALCGVASEVTNSYSALTLSRSADPNGRPFKSVQEMVDDNLTFFCQNNRCPACKQRMFCDRVRCDLPLILYVDVDPMDGENFTNDDMSIDLLDNNGNLFYYDLEGVIYSGGFHFISRFLGIDGRCYEYDGMVRNAECRQLPGGRTSQNLFPASIVDCSGIRRNTKGIIYKRRRTVG